MMRKSFLLTLAALGLAAAPAQAGTICVAPATGCDSNLDTLDGAINQAATQDGKDTIRLGAATYTLGVDVNVNSQVELVGAGRDATKLVGTNESKTYDLFLSVAGSMIQSLTLEKGDAAAFGLRIHNSEAEDITVLGDDARPGTDRGIYFTGASGALRNSTVRIPFGSATKQDWAVWSTAANVVVENSSLEGDNAYVHEFGGTVTIRRSRLLGHRAYGVHVAGTGIVEDSVVRAAPGSTPTPVALYAFSHGSGAATLSVVRSTVVGAGGGDGVRSEVLNCGSGGRARANIVGTTVSGFTNASHQVKGGAHGCTGVSAPAECPATPANANDVQWRDSHAHGAVTVVGGCRGLNGLQSGEPGFVSGDDLRPRQPSPLIDNGDASAPAEGEKDLNGLPRIVDGDGTLGPRRDIGAFEYQRQAPTVSASVTPASGGLSTLFTFTALGTDADGESVSYIWNFDDGFATSRQTVEKEFSSLGEHVGEVTALDTAGVAAKATAKVTVNPVATPVPPPGPVDALAPAVKVKGGSLRVNKRRKARVTITCPATESAPCQIAIAVSSAKRIALSGRRKRIASLGKGSGSVANGKTATVTITLSKKAYRYLRRKKRLPAKLAVTARDAAGNQARSSARVTLRAARR